MAQNTVRHRQNGTSLTNRAPSPNIWSDCPVEALIADPGLGLYFFDDFNDFPLAGTQTTQIGHGRYKVYNTGSGQVTRVSTIDSTEIMGGALQIALDTDNDSGAIAQSYANYLLSGLTSNSGKLWYEVCYAQSSVATNMAAGFLGLAEVDQLTLSSTVPFNNGDAISNSGSMIGFRIEEDGLGVIDTVYSDRATSFTNVENDTDAVSGTGDLVANTFKKLGMVYDPAALDPDRMITFYVDNVELQTAVSKDTLTGLTNLDANCLGLLAAFDADSAGTSFNAWLKWWRVAQLFPVAA